MFGPKTSVTIEPPAPASSVVGMPGAPGLGEGGDVHLLDRLSVIYRYRRVALSVLALVLVAGAVQSYTETPMFRATAQLQIEQDRLSPTLQANLDQNPDNADTFRTTEIQILKSVDLARSVAKVLDLDNNPEFSGRGPQPTGLGATLQLLQARITRPLKTLFGAAPTPVTPAAGSTTPNTATAAADVVESPAVGAFMAHLIVTQSVGSNLVDVTFESRDPQFAAKAANTVAEVYVAQNIDRKTLTLNETIKSLSDRVQKAKDDVESDKKFRNDYEVKNGSGANLDPGIMMTQVTNMQMLAGTAQQQREEAEAKYNRLKALDLDKPEALRDRDIAKDAQVIALQHEVVALQEQYDSAWAGGLREKSDVIIGLANKIKGKKAELRDTLARIVVAAEEELNNAKGAEGRARNYLSNAEDKAAKSGIKGISYDELKDQEHRDSDNLSGLAKELAANQLLNVGTTNNVRKMDSAVAPPTPFTPKHANDLLMAFGVGLALALMLAFGLDYLDDTIKTPEDITRKLRVPFLGLVPSVAGDRQPVLSGPVPHDFGEAYRALRTSLVFTSGGESTRIISVTSAQPLEGKTTTACNLGMVLAFGGARVLLIDADMRRPGVHKALKLNNTVGLSHLLVGQARVREAIQRTSDPNFCVMTAGRTPPNPSELLSSDRMKQLITNLKQGPFDWVIVDTPPVLAVTDAVILTPLVDCSIVVFGAEMTRRRLAERAVQMILSSRPKIMGAVLNRVNFDRNKYYYSRYYGYQYKSYYGTSSSGGTTPTQE